MEEDTLSLQLHKLSSVTSQETLDNVLTSLWATRRTGLRPPEKSRIQSLLNLPSLPEIHPVLACLRSLIRKTVHEGFTGDDLLKLFPPDLSLDLQSMLVLLLQKHQSQWKEELSKEEFRGWKFASFGFAELKMPQVVVSGVLRVELDHLIYVHAQINNAKLNGASVVFDEAICDDLQHPLPRTSNSYPVKTSAPPSFTSLPTFEHVVPFWPHQDDSDVFLNRSGLGTSTLITADTTSLHFCSVSTAENLSLLPRLRSMTWTLENRSCAPANRVAVITLKLQDYTKSSSGETEVKFQLTMDTLEAMLRSLTYISEQLSSMVGISSEPAQKKQKQQDNRVN
ncbi:hypothetical protein Tsubulata_025177 [Turnera subulata]|uniref:COMM domain-containing protein n=1 Tax=Turnera subulata TaxID=218843 RepID=A0A9Q0FBG3_9ROSI|nr:hypothetical protein Tsubulata_025177 [Turnera subulata]